MTVFLQREDRIELQRIITRLPEFSQGGQRARQVLLQYAGLDNLASGIDLSGPPRITAGAMLHTIEQYGLLPASPKFYALGALLDYLLALGDVPQRDATAMARIIVKYGLVKDESYNQALRDKYDLADVVVVQPLKPQPVEPEPLPTKDYYNRRYLGRLRDLIIDRLSEKELRELCYDAGIKYENLRPGGLDVKAQALIEYLERRRSVPEFLKVAKDRHDYIDWENP